MEKEMCNTDDSIKSRQSESEDVDKEEMCNTDDSIKSRQSESEDVDKEEMCNTDDSIKSRQSESEDVDKEDMCNTGASLKRRQSDSDYTDIEGATVTIKKRKQEIDEASAETQETGAAEVGTQTDAHEFILNEREPMIRQLKLTWTSNVDYQHQICDTLSTVDITRSPDYQHQICDTLSTVDITRSPDYQHQICDTLSTVDITRSPDYQHQICDTLSTVDITRSPDYQHQIWDTFSTVDITRSPDYQHQICDTLSTVDITRSPDYQHQIWDTFSTVDITRSPDAKPTTIYVYNTDGNHRGNIVLEKIPNQPLQGKVLLYHGTDEFSAKNIIEQGIDIKRSTRSADFSHGNGFYVTKDYGNALEWSKIMVQRSRDRAAVIVFKIDTYELDRKTHLSLKVDNETNMTWWQCIVSHFRHGQKSDDVARVLRDVKYIEGPMSADSGQEIPTPAASGISTQLCICDQEFAKTFGSLANIMCVVFVKF